MVVTWSPQEHGLGIPDIDEQHQQLFLLTNQILDLRDAAPSPERQRKVSGLVKQLYAYTRYHFSTEEAIFAHYGYPEAPGHAQAHGHFTKTILEELPASREPSYDIGPLGDLLVDWILNHIRQEDRRYADHFRSLGIQVEAHFTSDGAGAGAPTVRQSALALWKEKRLALDIGSIDHQHQELVLILQQANDLQKASGDRRAAFLPTVIQKLGHYAQYHFLFEEELMSRHGYRATVGHQGLHQEYIQKIQGFTQELGKDAQHLNDEIILFLKHWIVDHILVEDKAFKTQCQESLRGDGTLH